MLDRGRGGDAVQEGGQVVGLDGKMLVADGGRIGQEEEVSLFFFPRELLDHFLVPDFHELANVERGEGDFLEVEGGGLPDLAQELGLPEGGLKRGVELPAEIVFNFEFEVLDVLLVLDEEKAVFEHFRSPLAVFIVPLKEELIQDGELVHQGPVVDVDGDDFFQEL